MNALEEWNTRDKKPPTFLSGGIGCFYGCCRHGKPTMTVEYSTQNILRTIFL